MKPNVLVRLVALCAVILLAAGVAPAADELTLAVRVESLDAVAADLQRVANIVGTEMDEDAILASVLNPLGLTDTSWINRSRPVAVVMPPSGLMLGAMGLVAALPVTEVEPALAALEALSASHDSEEGVHTFRLENGTSLYVVPKEGYLVAGASSSLVTGVDLASALARGDAPPGNITATIAIEPIAGLLQMSMAQGRQIVEQQLRQAQSGQSAPDMPIEVMGIYFDVARDMINNTRRIYVSAELAADHAVVHKRLIPRTDSTLAGLLAAQAGGLPDLARLIDPGDSFMAVAGQIQYTPAFLEALQSYVERYTSLWKSAGESGSAMAEWMVQMMAPWADSMKDWTACYRGDFAMSFRIDSEDGMRIEQLVGMKGNERCRGLFQELADVLKDVPPPSEGEPLMEFQPDALQYGGVSASRMEIRFAELLAGSAGSAEVDQAMAKMFGGDSIVGFLGLDNDLMVSAMGQDSEKRFKNLVDRIGKKKSGRGFTPKFFAPLEVGPGFFGAYGVEQLLGFIDSTSGGDPELQNFMDQLPEGAGRVVFGARMDTQGMTIELALPLGLLQAIGAASSAEHKHSVPAEQPAQEYAD